MARRFVCVGLAVLFAFSRFASARSQFDVLVESSKGNFPRSLKEVGRLLEEAGATALEPGARIFESRSLQRASRKEPRLVEAYLLNGRFVFIGYSKQSDTIEVISDSVGSRPPEPELQVFERVSTGKRIAGDDSKCLSCHRHGGPIFPRAPWGGVSNDPNPVGLDAAVRAANGRRQAEIACANACPPSEVDCRERLLWLAITARTSGRPISVGDPRVVAAREGYLPEALVPDSKAVQSLTENLPPKLRDLQRLFDLAWPDDGFAYESSTLLSRSNGTDSVLVGSTRGGEAYSHSDDFALDFGAAVSLAPSPGKVGDPRIPRPLTRAIPKRRALLYLSAAAFGCFGLLPSDANAFDGVTGDRADALVRSPSFRKLLRDERWPPSRWEILEALREGGGANGEARARVKQRGEHR